MTYPLGEHGEYPARRSYVGAYSFSPDTDKLPGDPAEAWGQQYVDEVIRAGNRKLVPEQATYLPAEESGSTGDAVDDAMSK